VKPRKSKGYGFVDVGSKEEQKKALAALDNKDPPHEDEGGSADTSAIAPEATIVASLNMSQWGSHR
jgi:hypothetical protein